MFQWARFLSAFFIITYIEYRNGEKRGNAFFIEVAAVVSAAAAAAAEEAARQQQKRQSGSSAAAPSKRCAGGAVPLVQVRRIPTPMRPLMRL